MNYRRAFDFVSEYLETGGLITEGLIREIHRRLVEGVRGGSAAPGEYRRVQNYVVNSVGEIVYTPAPAATCLASRVMGHLGKSPVVLPPRLIIEGRITTGWGE